MAHVKGHKRGCKCAICGRGKKRGTKKAAKRSGAKRAAAKRAPTKKTGTFLTGYHDGHSDVRSGKPLRKAHGKADYARGYREGVRVGRAGK